MKNVIRRTSAILSFSLLLFTQMAHAARLPRALAEAQSADAQSIDQQSPVTPNQTAPAPIPAAPLSPEAATRDRLLNAHNLFITDDGNDDSFPAAPGSGYSHFLADLQTWGRYNIVSTVGEADLVLQLRSATTTTVVDGTTDSPSASVYTNPYFRLSIADPATLKPLWVFTVPVQTGIRKKDKVDLFEQSSQNVVSQLKLLVGQPLTAQESAALVLPSRRSHLVLALVLSGVAVGAFAGLGIILHNKIDADIEKNKQQQLDFCKQHNIPNCAA